MPREKSENFFTELLKFLVLAAVIVLPVRFFIAQPFIVSGASMEPTFFNGQYLIVDELTYRIREPERGDVIIFRYPRDPSEYFIKRVIGLPGETVYVEDNEVSIKDKSGNILKINEPYIKENSPGRSVSFSTGDGEYFVMGDNRHESSDSRVWGTLKRGGIIGRAFLRLLPIEKFAILPGSIDYKE